MFMPTILKQTDIYSRKRLIKIDDKHRNKTKVIFGTLLIPDLARTRKGPG